MGIISLAKGILARILFIITALVTVLKVTLVYDKIYYWGMLLPAACLPIEFILTFKYTELGEWKWFCPSVLLYLLSVAPGIWLLQLHLYETRIEFRDAYGWESCTLQTNYSTRSIADLQNGLGVAIPGFNLPIPGNFNISDSEWTLALEQLLLLVLIVGRWLLPKGHLSRNQLSQLLLVYIGMAADILEFSGEKLEEEAVFCDLMLIMIILALWSWSLLQFTLVLTSVLARKTRNFAPANLGENICELFCKCGCCANEIWSLLLTMAMQDGPFLAMRLYLIIDRGVFNQMMIFFTIKNIMILFLQLYRIAILCCDVPNKLDPSKDEEAKGEAMSVTIEGI